MNELSTWMQGNWYSLGNLLAQFGFLVAGVWFARKILKSLRASQEQFGALLKLSMSDGLSEQAKASEAAHRALSGVTMDRPTPYVMADWPATATPALTVPEQEPIGKRLLAVCRGVCSGVARWLQAPMVRHQHPHWQKMVRWLQAPVRS